jgi:uncharacterized membrane protein
MEKRGKFSKKTIPVFVIFLFFLVFTLIQFIAPLTLPSASVDNLDGLVGVKNNQEKIQDMPFPWNLIYRCGDSLCHQKSTRSFFINQNQMPFCARCTAIWLGMLIGLGFMLFYKINLDRKFLIFIMIGLIPIGIDGFGQLFNLWESTNIMRVITGLLIGIICGIAIGIIIDELIEIKNLIKTKSN